VCCCCGILGRLSDTHVRLVPALSGVGVLPVRDEISRMPHAQGGNKWNRKERVPPLVLFQAWVCMLCPLSRTVGVFRRGLALESNRRGEVTRAGYEVQSESQIDLFGRVWAWQSGEGNRTVVAETLEGSELAIVGWKGHTEFSQQRLSGRLLEAGPVEPHGVVGVAARGRATRPLGVVHLPGGIQPLSLQTVHACKGHGTLSVVCCLIDGLVWREGKFKFVWSCPSLFADAEEFRQGLILLCWQKK
jgi:hypothetical protein